MDDSRHNSLNSVINEFVKKLLKSRGGPILVGIAYNAYPQIIFPPGLTFLASVFWTFLSYFSGPATGYLEEFKVLT